VLVVKQKQRHSLDGRADEGFAAYEGKVGQWDYEYDIRQKLNLDNSISFI